MCECGVYAHVRVSMYEGQMTVTGVLSTYVTYHVRYYSPLVYSLEKWSLTKCGGRLVASKS